MSARKLLRNDFNYLLGFLILVLSYSECCFLLQYWTAKSHKVFRALSRLALIPKVSNDKGKICSWVVQFHETCMT